MTDDEEPRTYLTLRREPTGHLQPYVNGERLMGWFDTSVSTNGNQQLVQVTFHASQVLFETDKPKFTH